MPDQIGDLLRGKPFVDKPHTISAAQSALAKLGYPVKVDGVEDGATRRTLRAFERAHGLQQATEITSELVNQLTEAGWSGQKEPHIALATSTSQ
jgi:peptidoglycan hydrolase-like protein with peptidoglycan-binding domain